MSIKEKLRTSVKAMNGEFIRKQRLRKLNTLRLQAETLDVNPKTLNNREAGFHDISFVLYCSSSKDEFMRYANELWELKEALEIFFVD
tara:strand:+ start:133 stop:396 length:264 start_codon:yes stop_codon:yes gene_type:complete